MGQSFNLSSYNQAIYSGRVAIFNSYKQLLYSLIMVTLSNAGLSALFLSPCRCLSLLPLSAASLNRIQVALEGGYVDESGVTHSPASTVIMPHLNSKSIHTS